MTKVINASGGQGNDFPAPSHFGSAHSVNSTPIAELFLPAAPARPRPTRARDLALLALAILCATAIATNVKATPTHPGEAQHAR
jgi:hypothetical protein